MNQESYLRWISSLEKGGKILEDSQREAKQSLEKIGFPKKSAEKWRYTNLNRLENILKLPINTSKESLILKINSEVLNENYKLPNGIEKINNDELIAYLSNQTILNTSYENFLTNLNHATNHKIIALKIKSDKMINLEIVIKNLKQHLTPSKILILVEKNAKLDILQIIQGSSSSSHSNLIEIYLDENSKVNHSFIAIGSELSSLLGTVSIKQEENSSYSLSSFQQGWYLSHIDQNIFQVKGNAKSTIKSLTISQKDQQLATHSYIKFNGPNGSVKQVNKSIIEDNSQSIFNGLIDVPKIAQKTNASQLSKNLLLSEKGRVHTSPQLKIVADDVKCNHGATISQLEEEQIFYLNSRGINRNEANLLLIKGFCKEIIDNFPINSTKWSHLSKYLKKNK